ncbi:MAG: rhomboid family intramembrane serine protease [Muribaculaceae bacterium]|nr:rhomboid family intramembrane serine protease [Muribaculaceae bacterium]
MYSSSSSGGWWRSIPPVTKNLIIINLIVWLAEILVPGFSNTLVDRLGLHLFGSSLFNPAQIFTYMFMHDPNSPAHILFNMFSLWMFGRILEQVWGAKRFLTFYLVCGVGAALVQEGVWELTWKTDYINALVRQNGVTYEHMEAAVDAALAAGDPTLAQVIAGFKSSMVTIGASGAIFGILLGFAFTFPDMPLYLFFIPVPIKAKYMVIGYGVIEFFLGVSGSVSTVAHFAHLGGMLFGILMLLYWKKKGTLHRYN